MKNLNRYLNESITNESITGMIITGLASLLFYIGVGELCGRAVGISPFDEFKEFLDDAKGGISEYLRDRKLKKIAEKYKDDPEVIEYLNNPHKRGWRKMLETKLTQEELNYLNQLTRRYFE